MAKHEFLTAPTPCVRVYWRIRENSRTAKDNERKLIYEKSNIDGHSAGVGLLCAFTRSASGQSSAGRVLSQLHDSGRVQRT